MEYNDTLINKVSRKEIGRKYNNSLEWRSYSRKITRNPSIRAYLYKRANGICEYCGLPLNDKWVVHHSDYDKTCITQELIWVNLRKGDNVKNVRTPPCGGCENFMECINDLHAIHSKCNQLISLKRKYKES